MAEECHALTLPARCSYFVLMSTGTIGDLIDRGYELRVYCEHTGLTGRRCNYSGVMDLEKAAAKLGRDHGSCMMI